MDPCASCSICQTYLFLKFFLHWYLLAIKAMFFVLSSVLILVSSMVSLEKRFMRVLSLISALIKYLNDGHNVMSILVIIIWFGIFSPRICSRLSKLYNVNSNIIARFLLVLLLQQHIYISIRFLFVNRLQLFPHILSRFTVDNMQKWFFIHWYSDYVLRCTILLK